MDEEAASVAFFIKYNYLYILVFIAELASAALVFAFFMKINHIVFAL